MPAQDTKITALTAITTVAPANDLLPIVDVSDNSMAASGTTKNITVNQILGAGGTATLASATITGAATVGTTLGVTGASSLSGVVTVSAVATTPLDLTNAAVTTERQIKITNSTVTAYLGVEPAAGNRFVGSAAGNAYFGTNVAYGLEFATANEVRMTVDTSGNVNVSSGNVVMSNGAGISFAAKTPDGSGTVGSELLNDYEEGTWTPVVADAATGGNVGTSTIASATYTKIGRQVSVEFYLQAIVTTGMTAGNSLTIRGLPFSATIQAQGSFYTYQVGRNAATVSSSAFVIAGNSYVQFFCFSTNSATGDIRILVSDIVSGTSELRMSVTYFV